MVSRPPKPFDAIRLAARLEGMITDPVYEGKSMAGLIESGLVKPHSSG
jgi:1-aminocyclopropane-1-carboxylate deaminase/D-cysteine desulfhydrase-like pyridoxal-dependent ACC family enzyme